MRAEGLEVEEGVAEAILNGLSADARAFIGAPPTSLSGSEADRGEFRASAVTECPLVIIAPIALVDTWIMMFDDRHPLDLKTYFDAHIELVIRGLLAKQ